MKVLMITGDKNFSSSARFAMQARAVEKLGLVYMGKGSVWPKIHHGSWDVVTAQDPFWRGLFAWYVARRNGARLNIQVHTDLFASTWFRLRLAPFVLRRADSIRVVSEKIKQQVLAMDVRAPVRVLPVFVDVAPFQNLAREPHTQKTILWLGRFEKEKDPLLALEVFETIRREGVDAKLIMLGAGSLEGELRRLAEDLSVEFPGWRDPKPYLAQADVVLCTSRHESWGASIVEALAAGVPVVALDVGIAREAGAIIKPRPDLAAGVVEVLQNHLRGQLRLVLLNKEVWVHAWKNSL